MSRRLAVLIALLAFAQAPLRISGQASSDTVTAHPKPGSASHEAASPAAQAHQIAAQDQSGQDVNSNSADGQSASQPPQIIVNPAPPPPAAWEWHDRVAWGSGIVLAVLGYAGIMLALRTLKSIERHLESGTALAEAAVGSANAALALAQAIANSERPWIVVTVEPFLTMENSFKVMASNRGRSPARIVSSVDQVKVAVDETQLPKTPEFEGAPKAEEPEPIVLLPGEATGIWALNREDLAAICKTPEALKRVERWQDTLFLYGRIKYMELDAAGENNLHETFWCCRYIHGEKSSALVMAGPPAYNKHS
jgi:hypothetical protein